MIEIKTYSKPKKTGSSGGSSSSTKYISGVISEAEHAGRADKAKRAEVADQANYAGTAASAQNAAYASEAGNLREDAEILQQYLSLKDTVDPQVVNGMVIFAKGLISNLLAQLKGGASFGSDGSYLFDKDGNLVIESAHSRDFDEMLQNGFALKRNPTSGKYTLSISDLIVWGRMVINTLETRKKYAIGGNVYLSGASSKIQHVEKVYSEDGETVVGYKCYILKDDGTMATQNDWVVGDQALCQTFDIEEGVYQNVSNQYYWRLVTQVSEENVAITEKYIDKDGNEQIRELYEGQKFAWVVLSKDDCDKNSGVPASGDTIVMDGHRLTENEDIDYTERTNVLMLEATGSGSPRIIALTGIVDYKHDTDNEVFILSPQKVIFTTEHFEIRTASGAPITFVHFMGPWVKGTEYHYYDQVSHANALWTCIVEKGKSTTDEPTDGNTYWRKEMSGGKGEKGDDAVIYTLEASPGYVRLSSDGSIDYTNGYIDKGDEYGSGKYLVVRGYKVVKGVRDNRFSTEASPVTLRLTVNDGSAYSEYTPSDGDSVSIDFEPKYEDSYYSMLEEISHSGLNSVRVDMCEGSEYNPNKILATCDIPIIQEGKDGQSGEGVVMAYKNATSRPEQPVTENLSLLTNGWSLMPQKGGSYEKVSNVSYGDYTVGDTKSGYSTSEWSEVADGGYTWQKSPAGLSDSRGWALMKVSFTTNVDNADVKVVIKAYSEANFDFIQVHELDKEITGSTSLRKTGVIYTSGNGVEGTYNFTSVGAGQHFFYVSYCKDTSGNSNGDYGLFRLDLSDNLVSLPSTVWMSQATLKDGKAVLPWSTPIQITGDDAYRVEVSPSTLVFDTNENGVVDGSVLSGKYATVTVYKGSQKISADNLSLPSNYVNPQKKYTNVDGKISNVNGEARITINKIEQETISGDEKVSKSSGQISFPIDVLGERSTLMWVTVNVQVNVSKFTGAVAFDNKRYKLQFDELLNGGGAATKNELKDATSKFEQTAREISLSVSEKSIGRRNLLTGSAFNRQEGFGLSLDSNVRGYGILMNDGVDGMNCIKAASYYDGTRYQYCGAFWGGYNTKNIRIKHGTQYTFSCWVKVLDANTTVSLEVIYNRAEIGQDRDGRPTGTYSFAIKEPNRWQLVKWSFTTDDTHDWIEANVFTSSDVYHKTFVARFCKPMLEEGDYNGWTLSQDDYDYVGGNMLDNTLSFDKSGSLHEVNGTLTPAGFGESTSIYKSFTYKLKGSVDSFSQLPSSGNVYDDTYYVRNNGTCYAYNGSEFVNVGNDYYISILQWGKQKSGAFIPFGLEANKDYVFSFMAKGTGLLTAYFYSPETDVFIESSLGATNISVDGGMSFQLTNKWERYWVHWRPSDSLHKYVLLRLNRSIQSNAGDAPITDCYIAQPKLEEGAKMTEYTERKSDLIDKASLKAAGIEITSDQVILYGNKVQVKSPKENPSEGYDEAAMFQNGKLNAQFINAGDIVAEGINAKKITATKLNVTGDSKIGIWHIKKVDGWGDIMQAEGTEYNGATVVTGIQYCPLFVRGGSPNTAYFRIGASCTEFSYLSTLNHFNSVWFGNAARIVCKGSANNVDLPTNYDYSTQYEPVQYIYSEQSKQESPALAINVIAKGFSGTPTAIQTNGAIRGVLAPNAMSISWDQTIPNGVGVVICTNGSDMTLTLPANPVEGQTLIIIQGSTSKVYIVPPKGDTIYWGGQTRYDTGNRFYSGTIGQFTILVFIRGAWQLQFMNNRP